MQMPKQTPITIQQAVDLSLTENLIPAVIHVKQYDHIARRIGCALYLESVLYQIPDGAIVNCTGTRPDGNVFQYSTETDPDVLYLEKGMVYLMVTDMMTANCGRVPVDMTLLDGKGATVGSFSFILRVERAALENHGLTQASYSGTVSRVAENMVNCTINEDGYLCIESDDGLGLDFSMDAEGKITISYNSKEGQG